MIDAYTRLHELGFAHSVEAWQGDALVGGLYGVSIGGSFFGESMFAQRPDCQVRSQHLARFGATEWSRESFLDALARSLKRETRRGSWCFDPELLGALRAGC
jgi:leucyl/phenylalanyl-tRNA--protein transferase